MNVFHFSRQSPVSSLIPQNVISRTRREAPQSREPGCAGVRFVAGPRLGGRGDVICGTGPETNLATFKTL